MLDFKSFLALLRPRRKPPFSSSMPFLCDAGSADDNVEHCAMLDQFPELWVQILKLVPELDR